MEDIRDGKCAVLTSFSVKRKYFNSVNKGYAIWHILLLCLFVIFAFATKQLNHWQKYTSFSRKNENVLPLYHFLPFSSTRNQFIIITEDNVTDFFVLQMILAISNEYF